MHNFLIHHQFYYRQQHTPILLIVKNKGREQGTRTFIFILNFKNTKLTIFSFFKYLKKNCYFQVGPKLFNKIPYVTHLMVLKFIIFSLVHVNL